VLAGGLGRRMGGGKSTAVLGGRPLLQRPIDAMRQAGLTVAVVAKPDTPLPELGDDIAIWREPVQPHHPLVGIAHALRVSGGPIVVCAGDMPFVPSALVAMLARCDGVVTVTASASALQPLLGRYSPAVLEAIDAAIAGEQSMRGFIADLGGRAEVVGPDRLCAFGDPEIFMGDVDTQDDLRRADTTHRHTQLHTH
jgi:molybdopterin-guanine dinucleotide biosynthesis protein A